MAVPWLWQLVTSLSPQRPRFTPKSVCGICDGQSGNGTGLISWVPRLPLWISFYCGSPLIISPGGCLLEASLQRHSLTTPSTWTTMTAPRMENIFLYNKSAKLNISFYIHTYVGAGVAQSVYCLAIDWTTGRLRFDPWQRKEIFPLTYVSRPAQGPT
jgi:hypothetical protein